MIRSFLSCYGWIRFSLATTSVLAWWTLPCMAQPETNARDRYVLGMRLAAEAERSCNQWDKDKEARIQTRKKELREAIVELKAASVQMNAPDAYFTTARASDLLGQTDDAFNLYREYLLRWEMNAFKTSELASLSICDREAFLGHVQKLGQLSARGGDKDWIASASKRLTEIANGQGLARKPFDNACEPLVTKPIAMVCARTRPVSGELHLVRRDQQGAQQDRFAGMTPIDLAVSPGSYAFRIVAQDYRDVDIPSEELAPGGPPHRIEIVLQRREGFLNLTTSPEKTKVRFEDPPIAAMVAPIEHKPLPVGKYTVRLSAQGYRDHRLSFVILDNEPTVVPTSGKVVLDRDPAEWASLHVAGTPKNAQITVAGQAPRSLDETFPFFPEGTIHVDFAADGHRSERQDISMFRGKTTNVTLALQPHPKWYWPSLGYALGGALLVAGGVVTWQAKASQDEFFASPSRDNLDRASSINAWAGGLLLAGAGAVAGTAAWHLWHHFRRPKPVKIGYE